MNSYENPLMPGSALPAFALVKPEHVVAAIDKLIAHCRGAVEQAVAPSTTKDYETVSGILDGPMDALGDAWGVVDHLQSVMDSPPMRAAHAHAQPKIVEFFSALSSDQRLFEVYRQIADQEGTRLTQSQRKALENTLIGFRLTGVELPAPEKEAFTANQLRASELSTSFSNRLQDATDAFVYWASAVELADVPEDVRVAMRESARRDGREDEVYKVTLQQPSLMPVLQFAANRQLRELVYRAQSTRASEFGPATLDNSSVIKEILALRQANAGLLGRANFAEVSLVMKMAESPSQVQDFLRDLAARGRTQAEADLLVLREFARSELGLDELEAWDVAYVSDKMRQRRYSFSAQEVKEYFTLPKVLSGLFSVWHPDNRRSAVDLA